MGRACYIMAQLSLWEWGFDNPAIRPGIPAPGSRAGILLQQFLGHFHRPSASGVLSRQVLP